MKLEPSNSHWSNHIDLNLVGISKGKLKNQRCGKKKTISPSHPSAFDYSHLHDSLLLPLNIDISDKFSDTLRTIDRDISYETRASKEEHSCQFSRLCPCSPYSTSICNMSRLPTPSQGSKELQHNHQVS